MEQIKQISEDIKKALSFEDKFASFIRLGEIEKETSSASIPEQLKQRILNRCKEHRDFLVGHLSVVSALDIY